MNFACNRHEVTSWLIHSISALEQVDQRESADAESQAASSMDAASAEGDKKDATEDEDKDKDNDKDKDQVNEQDKDQEDEEQLSSRLFILDLRPIRDEYFIASTNENQVLLTWQQ